MPVIYSANEVTHLSTDLISAIKNPAPDAPFASLGMKTRDALRKPADILQVKNTPKTNLKQLKHRPK